MNCNDPTKLNSNASPQLTDPLVFTLRRAYPMLVGRDIEVDYQRRVGVRSFSSLPPDLGRARRSGAKGGPYLVTARTRLRALLLRSADTQISPAGSQMQLARA